MSSIASKITKQAAVTFFLAAIISSGPTWADNNMKSSPKGVIAQSGNAPSNTPTSDLQWVTTPIGPMASPVSHQQRRDDRGPR